MRAVRILVIAVLACLGLVGVTASPAAACTCAATGRAQQFSVHDVVFLGTLAERDPDGGFTIGSVTYKFDVDEVYKGVVTSEVEVSTGVQSSACGLPSLKVRKE